MLFCSRSADLVAGLLPGRGEAQAGVPGFGFSGVSYCEITKESLMEENIEDEMETGITSFNFGGSCRFVSCIPGFGA